MPTGSNIWAKRGLVHPAHSCVEHGGAGGLSCSAQELRGRKATRNNAWVNATSDAFYNHSAGSSPQDHGRAERNCPGPCGHPRERQNHHPSWVPPNLGTTTVLILTTGNKARLVDTDPVLRENVKPAADHKTSTTGSAWSNVPPAAQRFAGTWEPGLPASVFPSQTGKAPSLHYNDTSCF